MPTIKIVAYANVKSPIEVIPAVVQAPVGPLTNEFKQTVSIVNRSSTPVTLSEPKINAEGAEAVLREIQPGFKYEADLILHPGFEAPRGKRIQFTAKSSLSIAPEVQVNIFQPWQRNLNQRPHPVSQAGPTPPAPQAVAAGH